MKPSPLIETMERPTSSTGDRVTIDGCDISPYAKSFPSITLALNASNVSSDTAKATGIVTSSPILIGPIAHWSPTPQSLLRSP